MLKALFTHEQIRQERLNEEENLCWFWHSGTHRPHSRELSNFVWNRRTVGQTVGQEDGRPTGPAGAGDLQYLRSAGNSGRLLCGNRGGSVTSRRVHGASRR